METKTATKASKTIKTIICIALIVTMMFTFCACNYRLIDTKWNFNYAYITMPNGEVIEVEINKWTEDTNSVTIQAKDGQVFSVGYHNVLLTKEQWTDGKY